MSVIRSLWALSREADAAAGPDEWWSRYSAARNEHENLLTAAMVSATPQDRLAFVVASAYAAALEQITESVEPTRLSLCVTEDGGNSPKAIETKYDPETRTLRGTKSFATLGAHAERFLVLADQNPPGRRTKDLVLIEVEAGATGVEIADGPKTPFCPELDHARVTFDDVSIPEESPLVKRGWDRVVKPFRMVEDLYVLACVSAWLFRLARESGQAEITHRLYAMFPTVRRAADEPPDSTTVALYYGGLDSILRDTLDAFDWELVDSDVRAMWERDRGILDIAARPRAIRLEKVNRDLDLHAAAELQRWDWTRGGGIRGYEGFVIWTDDGWLEWTEWERVPRGGGGGREQTVEEFLRKGGPSWAPDDIVELVREAISSDDGS